MKSFMRKIKAKLFNFHNPIPSDIAAFKEDLHKISELEIDDYKRSFYQYKIREKYGDCKFILIRKVTYYIMGHLFYFYVIVKSKRKIDLEKKDVVYYKISNNKDILPGEFKNAYQFSFGQNFYWDNNTKYIFNKMKIVSYNDWSYLFETLFSLANYSYIINKYQPLKIVTTYESSCASSILTILCSKNNIEHIDFMHGEKLYSHLNTLAHFNKIYVWDEYYVKLYNRLLFKYDDISVFNPWLNKKGEGLFNYERDICFYLNYESKESLGILADVINKLVLKGLKVMIRPHPSQIEEILKKNIIKIDYIENPKDISIFDSINKTDKIVSRFSTVLFQAYSMNKKIVIDNVSDIEQYNKLKEVGYIMIEKEHELLSDIL